MAPRASVHECGPVSPELAELRLLTEVHKLLAHLDEDGNVPLEIEQGVQQNLQTAVAEISMPYAVTTTVHRVEYLHDDKGKRKRAITWLGKNAVEVAMGGKEFHFSPQALKRVDIEIDEANHAEENIDHDTASVFISPKMPAHDAPLEIARAEHLADEDSIRVSTPVRTEDGTVVGRKMQSLLVTDIPLDAWVAMLKDPSNLFGKAFALRDDKSALSVMELFSQLELPEYALPDGPVTIVEAVVPFIMDELARKKVTHQIERFRTDQALYAKEATRKADEWYRFDKELARSLKAGTATYEIRRLIITLQDEWEDPELDIINAHGQGDTSYLMTEPFAAMLEKKKRLLLGRVAAVVTNNDRALKTITERERQQILEQHHAILEAERQGLDIHQIHHMQAVMDRQIARTNIKVGGGCIGGTTYEDTTSAENGVDGPIGQGETGQEGKDEDKNSWKWKRGVCQVKACPSPKPTEVGPCSVCRRCQDEFDRGHDPTKAKVVPLPSARPTGKTALLGVIREKRPKEQKPKPKNPSRSLRPVR